MGCCEVGVSRRGRPAQWGFAVQLHAACLDGAPQQGAEGQVEELKRHTPHVLVAATSLHGAVHRLADVESSLQVREFRGIHRHDPLVRPMDSGLGCRPLG